MTKFSLTTAVALAGIGSFVAKTIKFKGLGGREHQGDVLIKVVAHQDILDAPKSWGVSQDQILVDQYKRSLVYQTVYTTDETRFFPNVEDTGRVPTEVLEAMHKAADEVLDFQGKRWSLASPMSSGVSLSSTELAEEQSQTPSET